MKKVLISVFLVSICACSSFAAWSEYDRGSSDVSITMGDVVNRVRQIVDDPNSTNGTVTYSSSSIYDLVNTGQRLFCITTKALEASATQQLLANTTEYALPTNCLFLERVTVDEDADGDFQFIPMKTVWSLDLESTAWSISDSSQTPTAYYIRNRQLGLYGVPNNTGAIIKIWYIKYPALMTADTDVIFDNYSQLEPYWEALANYVAWHLYLQVGKKPLADSYAANWTQMLTLCVQILRHAPDLHMDTTGTEYK